MHHLTTNQIRRAFLDFFVRHGHTALPSSALVPHNDPTLMFTNSGMVQFKNIFTGTENPATPRATTSQKCVRAGGKHNDLDNVGYTARHHTFFEMLGNFSFGDYFKEDAIPFAWEFLTKDLSLPKEKLLVTVFHTDEAAATLWKKVAGLTDDRIIRIKTSDNFWSMGDTGPCGPCSEIFYDHGPSIAGGPPGSPDEDGDRFIEIWNLVFMQYEQVDAVTRNPLPKPCIDTGMGLERVAAVLQGVHSNYEIDLFRNLIGATEQASSVKVNDANSASFRVIADHLRSSAFLLADGVMPSNEGRGYVLRRIMRRAMRHVHHLGVKEPLMYRLFPALLSEMGEAYPELTRAEPLIRETLRNEEERFRTTLERGLTLLTDASSKLAAKAALPGDIAFKLYDTFGFPVDLTADILRGQGKTVDMAGFEAAMQKQKETARAAWSGSGDKATGKLWFELREKTGVSEFLGYSADKAEGTIMGLTLNNQPVESATKGDKIALITNQTPFYGESGGQMGDIGTITTASGATLTVTDTTKPLPDLIVHHATLTSGSIKLGEQATLTIDVAHRNRIRANHSATHILHAVLRKQLGEHVTQQGSSVAQDRFRFDFSNPKSLTSAQLDAIEAEVNRIIWQNTPVNTLITSPEEAVKAGAMALFGEKYGDEVRVVSMGLDWNDQHSTPERSAATTSDQAGAQAARRQEAKPLSAKQSYSVELCGGTHVRHTGDIGFFVILGESSVASGVRRIEAATGQAAYAYLKSRENALQSMADQLNCAPDEVPARLNAALDERKRLEKDLAKAKTDLALGSGGASNDTVETLNGIKFLAKSFQDLPAKELRGMADRFKAQVGEGVVALVTNDNGKASVVVSVASSLTPRLSAVDLVKLAVAQLGGQGGGGRPDFAQGGGPSPEKAPAALDAVRKNIA